MGVSLARYLLLELRKRGHSDSQVGSWLLTLMRNIQPRTALLSSVPQCLPANQRFPQKTKTPDAGTLFLESGVMRSSIELD